MLNRKPKLPDTPFLVKELQKELTLKQIASIIECKEPTLLKVANERLNVPAQWFVIYRLVDLYLRKKGLPVPMYGDNNQL